jgi:catechol 2,3-dioxygenase-like lactoylglutathione lyase family enzyme
MTNEAAAWWISSVLISVSDLDRSATFYQDVLGIHEVFREDQVAILGANTRGSFTLVLRQARRGGLRSGQQALGARTLMFDVGSGAELDRVQARLTAVDAFRKREFFDAAETIELVIGRDPDRLPVIFRANEEGKIPTEADFHMGLARMYAVDV